MREKCLAQEHNAVSRPGLEPGPPNPESSAPTIKPPRLPLYGLLNVTLPPLVTGASEVGNPLRLRLFVLCISYRGTQQRCSTRAFLLAGNDELLVLLEDVFGLLRMLSLLE